MQVKCSRILLLVSFLLVSGLAGAGCTQTGAIPRGWSGAVSADGTLFLGSMDGELVALEASTGARLWEVPLEEAKSSGGFGCAAPASSVAIYGTPAVAGDLVYVSGYNGKVYAINSSSGALRWVYPREGNLQPVVGGPVVASGRVYFGSADGKVYALDAATGDMEWEFTTGDKIWSTPAVDGDTLYIGSFDKKLYALKTSDGSKKWEFETEGAISATPLIYEGTVYIGSFDRYLYAVDADDGSLRWKFMGGNWFWARAVPCDSIIYAGCLDGKVYALDADTGDKVSEFDLGSPVSSSPVLVNSSLIVASEEGRVYSLTSNRKATLRDLEEKVSAPLCAGDGVVYVHTQKHDTLYAVNAETGVTLWSLPLGKE